MTIGKTEVALTVDALSVSYGSTVALRDVSFSLEQGAWLAVIGPNGAGKSSLIKALVGVGSFTGDVEVAGRKRTGERGRSHLGVLNPWASRHNPTDIAYVAQRPELPPGLSTAEYVLLGRSPQLERMRTESDSDRAVVTKLLHEFDLAALASRPITSLSGGEAQRAVLARALAQEPTIVALDEPTSSLDLAHQIAVLEQTDRLRADNDVTVVSSIHDLELAAQFASHFLLLKEGRVRAFGRPADVLQSELLSDAFGVEVDVDHGSETPTVKAKRAVLNS